MRRVLKWLAIFVGSVIGLLMVAVAVMYALAGARLNKSYEIQPVALSIPLIWKLSAGDSTSFP